MLDTIGNVLLCLLIGIPISVVLYIGVWTPKNKMKGHAGRCDCKCCIKN